MSVRIFVVSVAVQITFSHQKLFTQFTLTFCSIIFKKNLLCSSSIYLRVFSTVTVHRYLVLKKNFFSGVLYVIHINITYKKKKTFFDYHFTVGQLFRCPLTVGQNFAKGFIGPASESFTVCPLSNCSPPHPHNYNCCSISKDHYVYFIKIYLSYMYI